MEMLNVRKLHVISLHSRDNERSYWINRGKTRVSTSTRYLSMSFSCTRNLYLFDIPTVARCFLYLRLGKRGNKNIERCFYSQRRFFTLFSLRHTFRKNYHPYIRELRIYFLESQPRCDSFNMCHAIFTPVSHMTVYICHWNSKVSFSARTRKRASEIRSLRPRIASRLNSFFGFFFFAKHRKYPFAK